MNIFKGVIGTGGWGDPDGKLPLSSSSSDSSYSKQKKVFIKCFGTSYFVKQYTSGAWAYQI